MIVARAKIGAKSEKLRGESGKNKIRGEVNTGPCYRGPPYDSKAQSLGPWGDPGDASGFGTQWLEVISKELIFGILGERRGENILQPHPQGEDSFCKRNFRRNAARMDVHMVRSKRMESPGVRTNNEDRSLLSAEEKITRKKPGLRDSWGKISGGEERKLEKKK